MNGAVPCLRAPSNVLCYAEKCHPPPIHTFLKWRFLADFKKYTHTPPPPLGDDMFAHGSKTCRKCQNPQSWHTMNVPERCAHAHVFACAQVKRGGMRCFHPQAPLSLMGLVTGGAGSTGGGGGVHVCGLTPPSLRTPQPILFRTWLGLATWRQRRLEIVFEHGKFATHLMFPGVYIQNAHNELGNAVPCVFFCWQGWVC